MSLEAALLIAWGLVAAFGAGCWWATHVVLGKPTQSEPQPRPVDFSGVVIPSRTDTHTRWLRTRDVWWISADDMVRLLDEYDADLMAAADKATVQAIRASLAESVLSFDLERAEREGGVR